MSVMEKLKAQAAVAREKAAKAEREPAVWPDRTLNYTSVSAVKKFTSCPSAWFYRYVERREDPSGPGADVSTKYHGETELYLKTGRKVLSDVPRAALPFLEAPGAPGPYRNKPTKEDPEQVIRMLDISAEQNFGDDGFELTAAGVRFKGYIDLVNPRGVEKTGVVRLRDWKFKSDIVEYGCEPEELLDVGTEDGIQMVGYAMSLRNAVESRLFPGWEHVRAVQLEHLHVQKAKPKKGQDLERRSGIVMSDGYPVRPIVAQPIELQSVPALWTPVEAVVERMKEAAKQPTTETVDADTTQCRKYGGCNFKDFCPHYHAKGNRKARLAGIFNTQHEGQGPRKEAETMGVIANLKKSTAAAPVAPPPEAKKSIIEDQSTEPDDVVKARLAAKAAIPVRPTGPALEYVEAVAKADEPAKAVALEKMAKAEGILPPDAPKSTPPAASAAPVVQSPPAETVVATEPKALKTKKTKTEAAPAAGVTLYLRGTPTKAKVQPLSEYVTKLEADVIADLKATGVAAAQELEDLRLASGNDIGFGKWKAYLASAAKDGPPTPGAYAVLPGDDRTDTVVAALETLATVEVVR